MKGHFRMLAHFSFEVPDDATEAEKELSLKEVKMNLESLIPADIANGGITGTDQAIACDLNGYQVVVEQMLDMSRYCGPDSLKCVNGYPKQLHEDDLVIFRPFVRIVNRLAVCDTGSNFWTQKHTTSGVRWVRQRSQVTGMKNGQ